MALSLDFIFSELKTFYKHFLPFKRKHQLPKPPGSRNRKSKMPLYQVLAVMILFHASGWRNFQFFYEQMIQKHLRKRFPNAVSYSWFLRLRKEYMMDLCCFLQTKLVRKGHCHYIDSTPIKVCHNRRIGKHKTFKGIATRGHHSMGWFFGFKLHLIITEQGELCRFKVTKGNVSDIKGLEMADGFEGLLCGDKGYISQKWAEVLAEKNIKLITKKRRNMKKQELNQTEKFYLRGRGIVETCIGQMKNIGLENSKLRSLYGLICNILSCLSAYVLKPFKPSLSPFNFALIRS